VDSRRATPRDAGLLAGHRAFVWQETAGWDPADLEAQRAIWTTFFADCLAGGTYVAFVAEDGAGVVGSGGLLVHLAIPRPGLDSDRAGRVQSLYVTPAARRRGIARAIMRRIVDYAREAALITLVLRPSPMGRSLYTGLGFAESGELQLRFTRG
jgi:GNAT superfamily N-acetyltransferase